MPKNSSNSQFTRTIEFLSPEGFEKLQNSTVVIVGLGGVGSHATMALARSGVGSFRLVDCDQVTPTSLNRHAVALPSDVDLLKVDVVGRYIQAINASAQVQTSALFAHTDTMDSILEGQPDFVVDAIDSLNPKVALLRACSERNIPVVTSMGASSRRDPSLVRVAPLDQTQVCPLAKHVRKRLRRQGVAPDMMAVFSIETPVPALPPDESEPRYDQGRIRNRLPSLAMLPGIFGYALASVVIQSIAGYPNQ